MSFGPEKGNWERVRDERRELPSSSSIPSLPDARKKAIVLLGVGRRQKGGRGCSCQGLSSWVAGTVKGSWLSGLSCRLAQRGVP